MGTKSCPAFSCFKALLGKSPVDEDLFGKEPPPLQLDLPPRFVVRYAFGDFLEMLSMGAMSGGAAAEEVNTMAVFCCGVLFMGDCFLYQ